MMLVGLVDGDLHQLEKLLFQFRNVGSVVFSQLQDEPCFCYNILLFHSVVANSHNQNRYGEWNATSAIAAL